MVANLTLEEGGQGLPALWIRSDSRNVMENCLTEISAVWAYNPSLMTSMMSNPLLLSDLS